MKGVIATLIGLGIIIAMYVLVINPITGKVQTTGKATDVKVGTITNTIINDLK
jgi:hypothetical protein